MSTNSESTYKIEVINEFPTKI